MTIPAAVTLYENLMKVARVRLDAIRALRNASFDTFSRAEAAALHGRKVVESIAFACLVALDHGVNQVPRDAKGQWSAEAIFGSLKKKGLNVLPSPSVLRAPTAEEIAKQGPIKSTIQGVAERRLTLDELRAIYMRPHKWLHELNPYVESDRTAFASAHEADLWADLERVDGFIDRHFISIRGQGFGGQRQVGERREAAKALAEQAPPLDAEFGADQFEVAND